jgi:hypothetical protein
MDRVASGRLGQQAARWSSMSCSGLKGLTRYSSAPAVLARLAVARLAAGGQQHDLDVSGERHVAA